MTVASFQGVRVFLVDDHPAVREGLQFLLSRYGITVCGEAGGREETLQLLAGCLPDLVLVDLSLGNDSGLELLAELRSSGMRTLVYTMHDDARHIRTALTAGAGGYVTKGEMTDALREAITSIISGDTYLSPVAAAAVQTSTSDDETSKIQKLSVRELEIFRLLGVGHSAAEIALELKITVSTVETNLSRIVAKLELSGTKELRRLAIRHHSL